MRKFILLTAILVSTFAVTVKSQTVTPQKVKGSFIKFNETSHDFGTINEGTQATYEFVFTNTGDSNLILTNVQASCGCTTPSWPKQPIKPGQKDKITVVYNSSGRPGEFHKSITVTSNMKQDNVTIIYIKGQVTAKPADPNATPSTTPTIVPPPVVAPTPKTN